MMKTTPGIDRDTGPAEFAAMGNRSKRMTINQKMDRSDLVIWAIIRLRASRAFGRIVRARPRGKDFCIKRRQPKRANEADQRSFRSSDMGWRSKEALGFI